MDAQLPINGVCLLCMNKMLIIRRRPGGLLWRLVYYKEERRAFLDLWFNIYGFRYQHFFWLYS